MTRLGESAGEGVLADLTLAATRLADGRFVVYDWNDAPVLKLFDAGGAFLRTVGRAGQGPGEYARPSLQFLREPRGPSGRARPAARPGDRAAFARIRRRQLWFTAAGLLDRGRRAESRRHVFLAAISFAEGARGQPLYVVCHDGVLQSYGADPPLGLNWDSGACTRVMASARVGALRAAGPSSSSRTCVLMA